MLERLPHVAPCAEFPSDNPALHSGATWRATHVIGHPKAMLRATEASESRAEEQPALESAVAVELVLPEIAGSTELGEAQPICEADEPEPRPILSVLEADEPARSAFDGFIEALVAVLLASGATRAAAALPALLRSGRIEEPLAEMPLLRSDELRSTLEAWRAVLAGTSGDLSACGATMLDRWAAELLAVVLGAPPGRVEELRRDLRRRGVAAFGMLDAA